MPLFCIIDSEPAPVLGPVTLMAIGHKQCRFPVEEGLFCGGLVEQGRVYCPEHRERAFLKPRKAISVPRNA